MKNEGTTGAAFRGPSASDPDKQASINPLASPHNGWPWYVTFLFMTAVLTLAFRLCQRAYSRQKLLHVASYFCFVDRPCRGPMEPHGASIVPELFDALTTSASSARTYTNILDLPPEHRGYR
jgi:hypothetical protein